MPPKLYTKKIRLALSIEGKNHERIIEAAKPSNTSVTTWINIAIAEKLRSYDEIMKKIPGKEAEMMADPVPLPIEDHPVRYFKWFIKPGDERSRRNNGANGRIVLI